MKIAHSVPFAGKPVIHAPSVFGAATGKPVLYRIPVTGKRPIAVSVTGLVDGLSLKDGVLSGSVAKDAEFVAVVRAENAEGADERRIRFVVAPDIRLLTPLMGFTSWNAFGSKVTQALMEKTADTLISSGLADYGYGYVNIDSGWQHEYGGPFDAVMPNAKFPDMKGFCERTHALPRRFHRALGEVRADMSAHFGTGTVPADARFSRILFENDLQMAEDAANAENRALTPDEFQAACLDSAKRRCATEFVENAFKDVLAQNGGGKGERALAQGLMARHPDLADDLYDAGGPEAARAVLVRFSDEMREMALGSATLAEFDEAAVGILVHEAFAREIGLPGVPYARNELTFVGRAAGKLAKKIGNGVLGGTIAAKTPDEIRKLFRDEAGRIARKRAEMLRKVDAMGLSPNAAALLKTHLLTTDKTDDIDLDALRAASANLAEKTARLAELLDGGAPPDDVFRQIGELAPATAKQVRSLFPGQNVGSDEVSSLGMVVQLFALDAVEGLTDKVLAFFERADVKNLDFMPGTTSVLAADLRGIVSLSGSSPADLSNGLANGTLKPLFAVALAKACDDAGLANLPPAEKIARFAPDQPAGAALAQSLGALPPGMPVTPQLLQSLAAGALRQ